MEKKTFRFKGKIPEYKPSTAVKVFLLFNILIAMFLLFYFVNADPQIKGLSFLIILFPLLFIVLFGAPFIVPKLIYQEYEIDEKGIWREVHFSNKLLDSITPLQYWIYRKRLGFGHSLMGKYSTYKRVLFKDVIKAEVEKDFEKRDISIVLTVSTPLIRSFRFLIFLPRENWEAITKKILSNLKPSALGPSAIKILD